MRVLIKSLARDQGILAGTQQGRIVLARLLKQLHEPETPTALYLDFDGIEVATASFLRDGPLAYRRLIRSHGSRLYPVVANASDHIVDDLRLFLESQNDAMFACSLSAAGTVSKLRLVGRLDEKQALTLKLVKELGEVDAGQLVDGGFEPNVKSTAWNNRLSALTLKGLIMESVKGRAKTFRLPIEA